MAKQQGKPTVSGSSQLVSEDPVVARRERLAEYLRENLEKIAGAGAGKLARAYVNSAVMQSVDNPDLLKGTNRSWLTAVMAAAGLRIRPTGKDGRGYISPRWSKKEGNTVVFDPGYRGMIDVAMRSNKEIRNIVAYPVFDLEYQKGQFSYVLGDTPSIKHTPCLLESAKEKGPVVAAYSIAYFKDGSIQAEIMTSSDLKDVSECRLSHAIEEKWPGEMARKSAIRRLFKYLPRNEEVEAVLAADPDVDAEPDGEDDDFDVPTGEESERQPGDEVETDPPV